MPTNCFQDGLVDFSLDEDGLPTLGNITYCYLQNIFIYICKILSMSIQVYIADTILISTIFIMFFADQSLNESSVFLFI